MIFELPAPVVPAVRMTQRSMHCDPGAQRYLAWKVEAGLALRLQMSAQGLEMLPARTPLSAKLVITSPNGWHNKDADNQLKAAQDSANGILYPDDRWIDEIYVCRRRGAQDAATLRVEVL
jgi:Holliday junction resolvase RusA-like endonuclease